MGRCSQSEMGFACGEVVQQIHDTRQGLCFREVFPLQGAVLGDIFRARYGKLCPCMENFTGLRRLKTVHVRWIESGKGADYVSNVVGWRDESYLGARSPLQLCFDFPRQRGLAILVQDDIIAVGVNVFGVNQQSVHVEEAGADRGEATQGRSALTSNRMI